MDRIAREVARLALAIKGQTVSYDYMLVKGKAGGSLDALAESAMSDTIGAAADVKASISGRQAVKTA